jgi:hypothetical protein
VADDKWKDWDAGPVSRPYTLTGGRTRPRTDHVYDLMDVVGHGGVVPDPAVLRPEQMRMIAVCSTSVTVADLASAMDLPIGVLRILLADLVHDQFLEIRTPATKTRLTDKNVLRQILDGLQTL